MKRLRTMRFRSYVLPVILAALACRALVPSGFMTSMTERANGSRSVETRICSLDKERRGSIEIPGGDHASRCDHCLSPMGVAPIALIAPAAPLRISSLLPLVMEDPLASAPLQRAQLPRAPPHG